MIKSRLIWALLLGATGLAAWGQVISVTSPTASDEWCIGKTYPITWTRLGNMSNQVTIRLRRAGSDNAEPAALVIADGADNSQGTETFGWEIPVSVTPGRYFIRVKTVGTPAGSPESSGDSANFTVKSCPPLPDLVIEDAWVTPKHPKMGEKVEFHARLRNAAQAPTDQAHDAYIGVRGPEGFAPIDKAFRVKPLAANEAHEIFLDYPCTHWGIVTATVKLDTKPEIAESNEENNEKTYSHGVSPLPDLVACIGTNVHADVGVEKKIWAVAVNRGPAESPPCRLRWYVEQNGVVYRDVPRLDPGQEQIFHRDVRFDTRGNKEMTVLVDPDLKVSELNEENNKIGGTAIVKLATEFNAGIPSKVCADGK